MATTEIIVNDTSVNETQSAGEALRGGLQNFGAEIGQSLPDILGAAIVLLIGIIVANILANIVRRLVVWSRVDRYLKTSDLGRSGASVMGMTETGMKFRIADIAAGLVKWAVILLSIGIAASMLQWTQVTALMESIVAYLPNIAAAVLLLAGGYLLGSFVGSLVSGMGDTFGTRAAQAMGNVSRWSIFVFACMAALIQLGIAESIIQIAFIGLVAMLALAGGLAFGLGGRDKAREILSDVGPQRPMAI